jgi:release factor glutamine methyltransferase
MKENSKSIFRKLMREITLDETQDEKRSIVLLLLEKIFGITNTDVMAGKPVALTPEIDDSLARLIDRINHGEPVQYVVGEASFYGRKFAVNSSVLIPRPETEDLIRIVLEWSRSSYGASKRERPNMLDIGTGSGCIAVTLSLELKHAGLFAIDVSADALAVAHRNAKTHGAQVTLIAYDILKGSVQISPLDVIVSNPPYVALAERANMQTNVREFEPSLALFVPDDDPLIFYRAIASQSTSLADDGLVAVEINERYGSAVADLFTASGLKEVDVIKDFAGKDRFVKGLKK